MQLEFIEFTNGDAKRNGTVRPDLVNTNINIREARLDKETLSMSFDYTVDYAPDKSYIRISGRARFSGKDARAAYDEWKKRMRIGGPAGEAILNSINFYSSANAVLLSKAFGMMPPLVLPTLTLRGEASRRSAKRRR